MANVHYSLLTQSRNLCQMEQQLSTLCLEATKLCCLCQVVTNLVRQHISVSVNSLRLHDDPFQCIDFLYLLLNRNIEADQPPTRIQSAIINLFQRYLHTLDDPAKSVIAVLCADSRTWCTFPRIVWFLANRPEQYAMNMVKKFWYTRSETCLDEMPSITCKPKHCHLQQYLHLSTMGAKEVGLCKFADGSNFTNAHPGGNTYSCITVNRLHLRLMGLFEYHTLKWIVGFLRYVWGHEKSIDLIWYGLGMGVPWQFWDVHARGSCRKELWW